MNTRPHNDPALVTLRHEAKSAMDYLSTLVTISMPVEHVGEMPAFAQMRQALDNWESYCTAEKELRGS